MARPLWSDRAGAIWHVTSRGNEITLRPQTVRNMIRAGVAQSVAMSITGHRTISMFLRYAITSEDDKRKALRTPGRSSASTEK
jgi:hypothetical protein